MQPSSFAKLSTPKNSPVSCIFSPLFAATADDDDVETEQEKKEQLASLSLLKSHVWGVSRQGLDQRYVLQCVAQVDFAKYEEKIF